jgi:hypothetical protein
MSCLAKQAYLADLKILENRQITGLTQISKEEMKVYLNQTNQRMNGVITHLLSKTTKQTKHQTPKLFSLSITQIVIELFTVQ